MVPGDPFDTRDEAAYDAMKSVNPASVKENREYGGYLYEKGGQHYASQPVPGSGDRSPHPVAKTAEGDYHTHGDYSKVGKDGRPERVSTKSKDEYNSEHFSGPDKDISRDMQKYTGKADYKSYLGTPSGETKVYDPSKRKESVLPSQQRVRDPGEVQCKEPCPH
jgi:hypothetical protein